MNFGNLPTRCTVLAVLLVIQGSFPYCQAANQATASSQARGPQTATPSSQNLQRPQIVAEAERGITGGFAFTFAGPTLRAKPQRDLEAPISVSLRQGSKSGEYEARFIGTVKGLFDLSDRLETADGSAPKGLPSMMVNIVSTLPEDQRSDLFESANFQVNLMGGYRIGLLAAIIAWLAIPLVVIASKFLLRPVQVRATPPPPPATLAQQLKPLVKAATNRSLTTPEQAQLELLLVHFWRERAELPELSMAGSIQRLRSHPDAGPLLSAVEQWLHCGETSMSLRSQRASPDEIVSLLKSLPLSEEYESEPQQGMGGSR